MVIHAYDEIYLQSAQSILGHAVDYAVMTLEIEPDSFGIAFIVSNISKQFASGNPRYHEMDVSHFTERMEDLFRKRYPHTQLKRHRINCGMSQSELAKDSGVALRQIQLFEQRQRDINNAAALTLLRLSKSLHCKMEDLMEY